MIGLEEPVMLHCKDAQLVGILHRTRRPANTGVVIVVGGPQYRVGSHRQFVLLARELARNGIPVLRFDYRGLGDSEGDTGSFEDIDADIASGIDAFRILQPEVQRVVLWGLCDAASAAMLYASRDPRVAGLVLLNPWIRSKASEAKAYLRHYYISHLRDPGFWRRAISGRVPVFNAAKSLIDNLTLALRPQIHAIGTESNGKARPFPERMLSGLQAFKGRVLLIMSGNDLTAAEFKDVTSASRRWRKVLARPTVTRRELMEANHTFSSEAWRNQVSAWTLEWIRAW
jgi:exosortase A-associated hydrolase 1